MLLNKINTRRQDSKVEVRVETKNFVTHVLLHYNGRDQQGPTNLIPHQLTRAAPSAVLKGFWACVWDKWCLQLAYLPWEEDGFSGSTMGHILDTLPHFSFRENGRWPITTGQFSATKAVLLIRQLEATQRSQLLVFFLSLPHPFYINMWKCKRQSGIRCEDERLFKEGLNYEEHHERAERLPGFFY